MAGEGRLSQILERIREREYAQLSIDFVKQVAEIEERNVFDDERAGAQRELRQLIEMELTAEEQAK